MLELTVADCRHYAHSRERLHRKAHETISNLTVPMMPRLIGAMRRRGIGNISGELHPDVVDEYPPGWVSATDHIVVNMQKRQ